LYDSIVYLQTLYCFSALFGRNCADQWHTHTEQHLESLLGHSKKTLCGYMYNFHFYTLY